MMHNDMTRRYDELYEKFIASKDSDKMEALGAANTWLFYHVAEKHPALAEQYISKLEAGEWNNYVSKQEAEEAAAKLLNQDGTRGAHWPYDVFKGAVESVGGKMFETPIYNCWALWLTANMLFSDYAKTLAAYIPKEEHPKAFYLLALDKLKDPDRPKFVRDYFHLDE